MRLGGLKPEDNMDAADDQYIILQFDFADCLRHQSFIRGVYVTRLQRASKGSGQSTRSCGDNVVQGRGMGLEDRWRNFVMLRHGPMHSEDYRLRFGREISPANGSLHAFNSHMGPVNHFRHDDESVSRLVHSNVHPGITNGMRVYIFCPPLAAGRLASAHRVRQVHPVWQHQLARLMARL